MSRIRLPERQVERGARWLESERRRMQFALSCRRWSASPGLSPMVTHGQRWALGCWQWQMSKSSTPYHCSSCAPARGRGFGFLHTALDGIHILLFGIWQFGHFLLALSADEGVELKGCDSLWREWKRERETESKWEMDAEWRWRVGVPEVVPQKKNVGQ